ncbi:MAG: LysR family transcriptional regulator [Phreatobacter sp.]|uniref:LysR family transcriptional regulator n=1 Tax=Phreatobacter sp. TaxID=1966341 RepID=UPI002736A119|nr:LysR family transcriptional regulator [Phreatobacter sp.]MDP2800516.1 LysR family transcriptional regulator [Phreatobacter sp.]
MTQPLVSWDDYRTVLAVSSARSLAGAAELLAVNQSTVFRRLGAMEERLGARLFERSRTGYSLTAAGEGMVRLAERMSEDIIDFERRLTGQDLRPQGEVRVTTNDTLVVHLLTPIFASFRKAYPEITLDVVVGNQSLNLSKRDADVAIRATADPPETLVGRRLAAIPWAIYAAESLGIATLDPVDYRSHAWIGLGDNLASLKPGRWLVQHVGEDRIGWRINTVLGLAEAVAEGAGIGLLPCFIARTFPNLVPLSGPIPDIPGALWILTHPDLRSTARVRVFMDHVGTEIARRRGQIEGVGG